VYSTASPTPSTQLFYTRPSAAVGGKAPTSKKASPPRYLTANTVEPRLNQVLRNDALTAAVLDFNNIRGKDNFKLTSVACLQRLAAWAAATGLAGRVVVVVDHGLEPSAFEYQGLSLVFAGAGRTADDVIAALTRRLCAGQPGGRAGLNVVVATSDRELSGRCLAAGTGKKMAALRKLTDAEATAGQAQNDDGFGKPGGVQVVPSATLLSLVDWSRAQQSSDRSGAVANMDAAEASEELAPPLAAAAAVGPASPLAESVLEQRMALVLAAERRFRAAGNAQDRRHFKKKAQHNLGRAQRAIAALEGAPGDGDEDDDAASAAAAAVLSGLALPFHESSWHRVLSAEKLRRVFVDLPPIRTSPEGGGGGACARSAGAAVVAACVRQQHDATPSSVGVGAHSAGSRPAGKSKPAGGGAGAADGAALHPLLGDHRLRGDSAQRAALRRFVWADTQASRGAGGTETNETDGAKEEAEEEEPKEEEEEEAAAAGAPSNLAESVEVVPLDPPRLLSLARAKRAGRRARGDASSIKLKMQRDAAGPAPEAKATARKQFTPGASADANKGLAQGSDISAWLGSWELL
jgi:hypothetical protein